MCSMLLTLKSLIKIKLQYFSQVENLYYVCFFLKFNTAFVYFRSWWILSINIFLAQHENVSHDEEQSPANLLFSVVFISYNVFCVCLSSD